MKKLLIGTTIIMGLAAPAFAASNNSISIDIGNSTSGTATLLAIVQDDANASNVVSGNGANPGSAFPVDGPWNSIAINQTGPANILKGGIKSATGSTTASLNANYAATGTGGNTHSLSIGGTTAPVNPTVTIYAKNNGATVNTITDTLNGSALSYQLGLLGTGNTVTNNVTTTGSVTLNEGDGNLRRV
jgi:hypothetical protein